MDLPASISTGRVVGQFVVGIIDGADPDDEPDLIPARGTIAFTPSIPYLQVPVASPNPFTILETTKIGVLDALGYLCTPDPVDPSKPGARGVRLISTDNTDASVKDWTWIATPQFENVNGTVLRDVIKPTPFHLPGNETRDLTTVVKVPASEGIGTDQALALAEAAQQAAQSAASNVEGALAAAESAQEAARSAAADLVELGNNTAEAVKREISTEGSPGNAAVTSLVGQMVPPQVQRFTAQYLAEDGTVAEAAATAAAAAINANPKVAELEATSIRIRGSADTIDLNTLFRPQHFGTWEVFQGNSANLPAGFTGRGSVEVVGATQYSVSQRVTSRNLNRTWRRTATDTNATPPAWSAWVPEDLDPQAIRLRGSADTLDLNSLFRAEHIGTWEVHQGNSANLPTGFSGRGTVEVVGVTQYSVSQRVTARDLNRVWRRTAIDTNATPARWSEWVPDRLPDMSALTSIGTVGDSLGASHNLYQSLGATLPGVTVYGRAYNGDTTDGLLLRLGVHKPKWKVVGGTIPAAAVDVPITTGFALSLPAFPYSFSAVLAGVAGTIKQDGAGGYSFQRTTAGNPVAVSGAVEASVTWAATTWLHTLLVVMGRNDVSLDSKGVDSSVAAHVVANYQKLVDNMGVQNKVFMLLGTINRTIEPRGHEKYDTVIAINRMLAERFPGNFIDIRSYLVNQVIHDLGITPTAADLANMANDCPPPSVMVDVTHFTDAAAAKISEKLLKPWLVGKGHFIP